MRNNALCRYGIRTAQGSGEVVVMSWCKTCEMPVEAGAHFCGGCGASVAEPSSEYNLQETLPLETRAILKPAEVKSSVSRTQFASSPPPALQNFVSSNSSGSSQDSAEVRRSSLGSPNLFVDADPYLGTTLNNRFVIESKLGEGGFGAVYKGVQKGSNRAVALKLLHPEMTRDKNVVQRFRREGQVLCALKDAHTVTTYDFDQTADGTLFIAMELLEGQSLHDVYAADAPIAWQRMLKIVSEMCSSLGEAHAMGIVHRDLKPENVHLEKRSGNEEFVKILDFGIAKMLHGDGVGGAKAAQLTATGQTLGTLEYMSPEQLMGKDLDGRSDIYGLGVLAYELLTGRLPFPDAVGPAMLISAQLRKTPESLNAAFPPGNFPRDVELLLVKMLGKTRDDRFVDVAALRNECLRILASDVSAAPQIVVDHASSSVESAEPATSSRVSPNPQPLPEPNIIAKAEVSELSESQTGYVGGPGPSTQAILAATAPKSKGLLLGIGLAVVGGGALTAWLLTQ